MMQALYEAILVDERLLEDALKYEVLARQAEVSDDQALVDSLCKMRDENRRRAERAERLLAQRLPDKKRLEGSSRGHSQVPQAEVKSCHGLEEEVTILVEKLKKDQPSN
jgi:hypothetical protein